MHYEHNLIKRFKIHQKWTVTDYGNKYSCTNGHLRKNDNLEIEIRDVETENVEQFMHQRSITKRNNVCSLTINS